ncbi:replication protein [Fictibacillus sp. NRS-1165]|uniref:replication protein n=1 Tax=Fictibacillus sp. NRS-1165 TaxID=3144463 RepID=UPI003D1F87C8
MEHLFNLKTTDHTGHDLFCCLDLTKRQVNILNLIARLTISDNQETCIIPKLNDFEFCAGVDESKVKKVLGDLEDKKVIFWKRKKHRNDFHEFQINSNVEEWEIDRYEKFDCNRLQQLIDLNSN